MATFYIPVILHNILHIAYFILHLCCRQKNSSLRVPTGRPVRPQRPRPGRHRDGQPLRRERAHQGQPELVPRARARPGHRRARHVPAPRHRPRPGRFNHRGVGFTPEV